MSAEPAAQAAGEHPFRTAWRTRDLKAWADAISEDVVLHSPLIRATFNGRAAAIELYGALFEALDDFEITTELGAGDTYAFFWRADAHGRAIEGADLIRHDSKGKLCEIRVYIRPLVNIGFFSGAVGPALARGRRPGRAALLRFSSRSMNALFAAVDAVATRLTKT